MIIICFCVSMSDPNNKKDDYFSVFFCLILIIEDINYMCFSV